MPGQGRKASSPLTGGMRDIIRTFVAFVVAFGFTKLGGGIPGVDQAGLVEAIVVIVMSAILAFTGKAFRNSDKAVGKVI